MIFYSMDFVFPTYSRTFGPEKKLKTPVSVVYMRHRQGQPAAHMLHGIGTHAPMHI